ncbi:anaerobic ribonucleoside-triphosphate reductase-activating protein [Celerinatantimonas sp. YJH-8]|uniref:anaerobic ribonucleoside-triphosphate reductase-activating protein n=1 Tax=Celerinatantimonas sp. YJH-8 TaxID=3228714 RepID=UPI0038C8AB82
MHYSQYYPIDVVNGPGTRCALFVSGCTHQCKGCYNQATWRFDAGCEFDDGMLAQIIGDLQDTEIPRRGLTLSGGDPLHPNNLPMIHQIVSRVKTLCPSKDIWCWTGYLIEELTPEQWRVAKLLDVVVDGPFKQELLSPELPWQGSSNQRIIHIAEWIETHSLNEK